MTIDLISIWHEKARPSPKDRDFQVQTGCHFEEVAEMLEQLSGTDEYSHIVVTKAAMAMHKLAEALKGGAVHVAILDRGKFLDAICDQIVTGTGVGHCANMNVTEGVRRVNDSNWSCLSGGVGMTIDLISIWHEKARPSPPIS